MDHAREAMRGAGKIGTTGRGIGPAYEDKVARRAVRLGDLASEDTLRAKLKAMAAHHNVWLRAAGEDEADPQATLEALLAIRDEILPFAGQRWRVLEDARANSRRVLFEGAQGVMLDIDHGTYPFVPRTSRQHRSPGRGGSSGSGHTLPVRLRPDRVGPDRDAGSAAEFGVGDHKAPTHLASAPAVA
ncbi:MAG: hypothetical protein CM15mP115_18850 [Alphaproteobacteria bacterium]|nr:MAG: hypothetical protein CM15mP115_18850 [Alphaproteobacteria bacterium]